MSEENTNLYDLLDLSIGSPQKDLVNFSALHSLLLAVLRRLTIWENKLRRRESAFRDVTQGAPVEQHPAALEQQPEKEDGEFQRDLSDSELDFPAAPIQATSSKPEDLEGLWSRIQICEDSLSEVKELIKELLKDREDLQEKARKFHQQQKEKKHRVTLASDSSTLVKHPSNLHQTSSSALPDESSSTSADPHPSKVSGVTLTPKDPADPSEPLISKPSSPSKGITKPVKSRYSRTPVSKTTYDRMRSPREESADSERTSDHSLADVELSVGAADTEGFQEMVEAVWNVRNLQERFGQLEAHIEALEEQMMDQMQLDHMLPDQMLPDQMLLDQIQPDQMPPDQMQPDQMQPAQRQSAQIQPGQVQPGQMQPGQIQPGQIQPGQKQPGPIQPGQMQPGQMQPGQIQPGQMQPGQRQLGQRQPVQYQALNNGKTVTAADSQDESSILKGQLKHQRALIERLIRGQKKLESLEEVFMNMMNQDRENISETSLQHSDSDIKAFQMAYLRKSLQTLEEDIKHLREKETLWEERPEAQHPQVEDLRQMVKDMIFSLSSDLSSSLENEEESKDSTEYDQKSDLTFMTRNLGRKLKLLFQHNEQLQNTVNDLVQKRRQDLMMKPEDRQANRNNEMMNDLHKAVLELQDEFENLKETTRNLQENNETKQIQIEELYKNTEELKAKKADKYMLENEIKADKSALDGKVSRLQFDTTTEQFNSMFHELLNKITDQEQDLHKVIERLSSDMESKLTRSDLESVKQQLEDRWKSFLEQMQNQGTPEHKDAAAFRKPLSERFHCLSCDRPIVKHITGKVVPPLPSFPAFPNQKSIRPITLEQTRLHHRSRRVSELLDYSAVPRSSVGNYTSTLSGQLHSNMQHSKAHPEMDSTTQEINLIGIDGRIYRGCVTNQSLKNTDIKLPKIPTKDGTCKMRKKNKISPPLKPMITPEVGPNTPVHSQTLSTTKSLQFSRSVSNGSGPASPLCSLTSPSSVTQPSAGPDCNSDLHTEDL